MSRAGPPRRLATILFVDILDSTQIATELSDQRWTGLLGEFRRVVRAELKRYRGREEDTAGDGFFATFAQPAEAVRAAASIVRSVQHLGLDVRCGVHFGECEKIEGHLGGIAVHIGSRIMALGGAAEVLVSSTVGDLIVGTEVELEDRGSHELKGVPGSWQVWRLKMLDGSSLPASLEPEQGAALRNAGGPAAARMRRRVVVAGGALLGVAALVATVAFVSGHLFAAPSVNLVKIDAGTNSIVRQLHDAYGDEHLPGVLWAVNGALWQGANKGFEGFVRRNMGTGEVADKIPVSKEPSSVTFGFGSIWLSGLSAPGSIDRWDAVSGRSQKTFSVDGKIASMDAGSNAIWVLGDTGKLFKVDPLTNAVTGTYDSHTTKPGVVVSIGDHVWVCDCDFHRLVEFDPVNDTVLRTLTFKQAGYLVGLTDAAGATALWLLDQEAATLTPIDQKTGEAGQPIGIGANLHTAVVGFGSVWVAAGDKVLRVQGSGPTVIATIAMPGGFSAGSIAADPETGSLWVADCGCPIQ
jgi:class 3 adenylate cyclase